MPRAEVGSTKHLNNKMKAKGLQRLRWYCQICERQMRDENGFKCHVQSESHVRQMLLVGEDPKKYINNFSTQFQRDFMQLLRVGHGEKKVHINQFYQEYISNKEHVHMNATKWPSLTEFAKHLGREGLCRVTEDEKGLYISWVDNSPEALRRQDASRRKDRQDRGDEEREQRLIQEQIDRAKRSDSREEEESGLNGAGKELQRIDGEKIKLDIMLKSSSTPKAQELHSNSTANPSKDLDTELLASSRQVPTPPAEETAGPSAHVASPVIPKVSLGLSNKQKPKNVFANTRKNPLAQKKGLAKDPPKKVSEVERIMKEEMERKRSAGEQSSFSANKRQRY